MWDSCIWEILNIQINADILYVSRKKIYPSISISIGLPWRWGLAKDIIMKKLLIIRVMNSWMLIWKCGIVQGCGSPVMKTSENWIGYPPLHDQGEAVASHGNVAGVWLTHKVGATWDEDTDRVMPHQFGGGFQELAEISEVSSCRVAYPDWAAQVPYCAKNALHWGKLFSALDVRMDKCDRKSWRWMDIWFPKGRIWSRWRIFPRILARSWN